MGFRRPTVVVDPPVPGEDPLGAVDIDSLANAAFERGREQGRQEGIIAGRTEGRTAAAEEMRAATGNLFNEVIGSLESQRQKFDALLRDEGGPMTEAIVGHALTLAKSLIGQHYDANPGDLKMLLPLVDEALSSRRGEQIVRVTAHPTTLSWLPDRNEIVQVADETMLPGGGIVSLIDEDVGSIISEWDVDLARRIATLTWPPKETPPGTSRR